MSYVYPHSVGNRDPRSSRCWGWEQTQVSQSRGGTNLAGVLEEFHPPPPPPDFSHFGVTCELKHEPVLERPVSQGFKPKG